METKKQNEDKRNGTTFLVLHKRGFFFGFAMPRWVAQTTPTTFNFKYHHKEYQHQDSLQQRQSRKYSHKNV